MAGRMFLEDAEKKVQKTYQIRDKYRLNYIISGTLGLRTFFRLKLPLKG